MVLYPDQALTSEPDPSSYKDRLIKRYWAYQRQCFPDIADHFDRTESVEAPLRPPVFLRHAEWGNVLIKPGATRDETRQLHGLVPEGEKHKWFRSMNSSQALGQSVLGNMAVHGHLGILAELRDEDGLPLLGRAQTLPENFQMEYKVNYLGEPRPTSLDAYFGGDYRVAIECKFTEPEVGTCSRPRLAATDPYFCDGSYARQLAREERCSLTAIGVRYWRYVPLLFRWDGGQDHRPCPLSANYQLVRNILAIGVRPDGQVSPANGHAVLIYDERNPAFQEGGLGFVAFAETRRVLREPAMLRKCSWQRIVDHMRNEGALPWLTERLALKYGL